MLRLDYPPSTQLYLRSTVDTALQICTTDLSPIRSKKYNFAPDRRHLEEMYGIEDSPTLISNVTDAVIEEVKLWQNRPREELYPIVYLDALSGPPG